MRQHRIAWTLALGAMVCALALAMVRQVREDRRAAALQARMVGALALVDEDPSLLRRETRAAVRAAAVAAEADGAKTAEAACVLALQYEQEHHMKGAETFFRRAITLRPGWARPYASLGALLGRHGFGRSLEAERLLRRAVELNPSWAVPHNSLAVLLRIEGRLDEAEVEARSALELAPDSLAANNNFANLLVALGRLKEAETYFQKAISLSPEHPKPHYNLACVYALQGRTAEAVANLREAVKRADILRKEAATDPDFESIRNAPDFRALVWPEGK